MVVASGTLRCSASRSFVLLSTLRSAFLLPLLSSAIFTTTVAAQQSVGQLDAIGGSGDSQGTPTRTRINLLSGSSIHAGLQIATLNLKRGGKVLVCPDTKLVITTSADGRGLVFQLDSGNLEFDYSLASVADTLVTPKLRLMMSGPGILHQAVGVSPNGDTCVQSLPANRTWVLVSDARSDTIYQIQSDAAVEFKGGSISGVEPTRRNCGCPTSPPSDNANAIPSGRSEPTQPSPQPQPIVAKEDLPVDASSASDTAASSPNPATVARSLPAQHPDSPTEGQTPELTASPTTLLPQAASTHKELAKPPAARQMSGSFTVQVGSFRVKENAYRLAERLKSRQYPVEVREVNDSSHQLWYVVRVGKYENRSFADSAATKLASEENLGLKPIVCAMYVPLM